MDRHTRTKLLIAGGVTLVAGGLIYVLTRKTSSSSSGGADSDLDALLKTVVATRNGPDYETILTYGPWAIDRERSWNFPNLGPGSVARLRMYPKETGYEGPHESFPVLITKARRVGSFAIYEGTWVNIPGGLDTSPIVFTSADVSSVIKTVSAVS